MKQKSPLLLATFAFFMVATLSFLITKNQDKSSATDANAFHAGNIISDYVMSNHNSMSVSDINNFLHSKNHCNDTNLAKVGYYLDMGIYHIENNHFVCLADESFDGRSAAQVIYDVAQRYRINPQVLIVLLEKEQSLITDTYPYHNQIAYALGYGCYDDAEGCRPQYGGFETQLNLAAELFREVLDGGWSNYHVGDNYVQYHPDSGCGGTTVHIENLATASLYRYTPYQPNQSALNAGYGTGDYCASYGNRNFFLLFSDWFGDPTITHYTIPAPSPQYEASSIADGEYYITSALDETKALDVENGSTEDSANIQLYEKWGTDNGAQKWRIKYDPYGHFYTIKNLGSGKYLDISGGGLYEKANIWQYSGNGTCAQRWHIKNTNGALTFYNACNENYALDVTGGSASNHTNIQLHQSNNTKAQQWYVTPTNLSFSNADRPITNGEYYIASDLSLQKVLDVDNGSIENSANIQLYDKWGIDNSAQLWYISYDSYGQFYTIKNLKSGKLLDIKGGSLHQGTNIQQFDYNGTCAQRWHIKSIDNALAITNACDENYVLDLAGAVVSNHTNIHLYQSNNTKAQRWHLIPNRLEYTNPDRPIEDGEYYLSSSTDELKVLDVQDCNPADHANIQLYERSGGTNNKSQLWNITYDAANHYYTITSVNSYRALDVSNASMVNHANIQTYSPNNSCAQHWYVKVLDGHISFLSACNSNYTLDLTGGITNNHANIQLYQNWRNDAQLWLPTPSHY